MSDSGAIGPVERPRFDQALSAPPRSEERQRRESPTDDGPSSSDEGRADRFEPSSEEATSGVLVLELLRERVLAHTARALRLDHSRIRPTGYEVSIELSMGLTGGGAHAQADSLVDGLAASQNRLAATRRRTGWSAERVDAAVAKGTLLGVRETLDLLEDSNDLDDEAWAAVSEVVFELARRLGAAGSAMTGS